MENKIAIIVTPFESQIKSSKIMAAFLTFEYSTT